MPRNRRALLIAPYFLPRRRVGSMRPFRFAIHLEEFGWQPTVVTIAAPGQRFTKKEAELLQKVKVIELEPPIDRTTKSESQLGGHSEEPNGLPRSLASRFLNELDRQFPVDTWLPFFAARYRTMTNIVEEVNPHVIWATADPWSSLVIARHLALRYKLPFFPDFRDPWTLSELRTKQQWEVAKKIDRYFERRVLKDADVVVFQTPLVEAMYRRHYSDLRFASATISNSYDPAVFDDSVDFSTATPYAVSPGSTLRLGFFGRFRRMSPATLIVDVLHGVRQLDPAAAKEVEVHSFGPLRLEDEEYAADRGVLSCFHEQRHVPLEKSLSVLRQFDILLLSTERSRKEIIPAKLFEYLAAGRPILSLSRNPAVARILSRTGTGIQLTEAQEAAELLLNSVRAHRSGEPLPIPFEPNPDQISKFEARRTTAELARLFDAVVEPSPSPEPSFHG